MIKKTIWQWCGAAALLIFGLLSAVHAETREDDIQKYIAIFSGSNFVEQKQACEELGSEGLSDPRLFDLVEKKLLAIYKSANARAESDYAAWLSKALSFSGQEKYRSTLQEVANNGASSGLRKYAKLSGEQLSSYTKWNAIINNQSQNLPGQTPEINRFANMLRSGDKGLQEVAARRIIEQPIRDTELMTVLQKVVTPDIAINWTNDDDVKAVAYMLKALAATDQPQFLSTVAEASQHAASSKVRRYAEGYMKKH
jgi:hypothetical protein